MILVCHADDGHFTDGDHGAVRRVLQRLEVIHAVHSQPDDWYIITCHDGGQLHLYAPGLDGHRSFRRLLIVIDDQQWTRDAVHLLLEIMRAGGFGLMARVDAPQMIVTLPRQVLSYPWLPDAPLLARTSHDLATMIQSLVA